MDITIHTLENKSRLSHFPSHCSLYPEEESNVTAIREIKLAEALSSCTVLWTGDGFEGQFSVLHQYKIISAQLYPFWVIKRFQPHLKNPKLVLWTY